MKSSNLAAGFICIAIGVFIASVLVLFSQSPYSGLDRPLEQPASSSHNAVTLTHKLYVPVAFGPINTLFGVELPGIKPSTGLLQIQNAGATWTRLAGIWWPDVEPQEGVRKWSKLSQYDLSLVNASESQLNVVLVVRGTPDWAQKSPPWSCGPITQTKLTAFGNFMYDLVQRYSAAPYNVRYYQIVNEPDISPRQLPYDSLLGCWGVEGAANFGGEYYADMLKVIYPRVKQADSRAQLLLGGLLLVCDPRITPVGKGTGCNVEAQRRDAYFLKGILANNGKNYFDGITYHSYEYYSPGSPVGVYSNTLWGTTSQTTGVSILRKLDYIKSVLNTYGVTGKYIMNTETALLCVGCSSGGADNGFETTKAFVVAQTYATAIVGNLKSTIWFRSIDGGTVFNMAMLNDNLTPRKAYTAFQASRYTLQNGTYERTLTASDVGGIPGVKGYSFLVNGQRVWTLWSTDAQPKLITLPQMPALAKNMLGVDMLVSPSRQLQLTAPDSLFAYVYWNP